MKKSILVTVTNYSKYCAEAKQLLENEGFRIIENEFGRPMSFNELKPFLSDISGAVVGVDDWDEDVFKLTPKLEIIARFGVGIDNIDLAAAKQHSIKVVNARGANAYAVAELVVGGVIAMMRQFAFLDQTTREGRWERHIGYTLHNKCAGLIGFGAIGQYTAKLLKAFGAEVFVFDLVENKEAAKKLNVKFVSLDELLYSSDIISLHVPCTPLTTKLINEKSFEKMKPNSILVNTSRGAVVDENALYRALKEKRIFGAVLDVYESEPAKKENPLFELDNVIVFPHTGAETYDTYQEIGLFTAQAMIDVINYNISPRNWLNE